MHETLWGLSSCRARNEGRQRTARTEGDLWLNDGHQPILLQARRFVSIWLQHACWKKAANECLNLHQGNQSSRICKESACKSCAPGRSGRILPGHAHSPGWPWMKVCREFQSSAQPSTLQSERPGHPRKDERSGLHAFNICHLHCSFC